MSASIKVLPNVKVVELQNQGEHARIIWYSTPRKREGGDTYNVGEIIISSTYGTFSHYFTAAGCRSFERFLLNLGFDYLMGKFFGSAVDEHDPEATVKAVKEAIIEARKNGDICKETARICWFDLFDSFCPADFSSIESTMDSVYGAVRAVRNQLSLREAKDIQNSLDEPWRFCQTRTNPAAKYLWDVIWLPFCEHLRAEEAAAKQPAQHIPV